MGRTRCYEKSTLGAVKYLCGWTHNEASRMIIIILGVFVLGGVLGFLLGMRIGIELAHWEDIGK